MSANGNGSLLERASDAIQEDLDTMMAVLEDNQDKMPEGEYLRGMNDLYTNKSGLYWPTGAQAICCAAG